jgi:MFS family permease
MVTQRTDDPKAAPAITAARPVRPGGVLAALIVVVLAYGLLQTMLVPTLGVLQRDLRASAGAVSWAVLSATLLTSAVATPVASRLADRYGHRRVLLYCLAINLVGTVGAGLAPDVGVLIVFRAVQGISLAFLPLSFAIVREVMPPRRVPLGLALTSGLVGGTAGIGLLLGGVLVDHTTWRLLFAVGAVLSAAGFALTAVLVPATPPHGSGRLDIPGTLTLTAGLLALLLGITEGTAWGWTAPGTLGLFAAAAAVLAAFTAVERRVAHPVLDIALLTRGPLLIAHLGALALGMNQFVFYILLPRLAEAPRSSGPDPYGFGTTVTGAALILLPSTLLTLPASWSTNLVARVLGPRAPLSAGLALACGGGAALTLAHGRPVQVVLGYLVCGAGYGLAIAVLPRLVNAAGPVAQSGTANGANTVARTVGGALGSQIGAAMVAGAALPGSGVPASSGYTLAFGFATVVAGLGALLPLLGRVRTAS